MKKILLPLSLILFLTSSCAIIGLNVKRKTPVKPAKYPEFTAADTLRGKITKEREVYDVYYYDINIDINIKDKYIKGYVDMYFTALEDFNTLQIDLYDNLVINQIVGPGDSLRFERKYNAVFVTFQHEIRKGEHKKISVYYEGVPRKAPRPPWKGGFVWKKDKNKNPWVGVACEVDGASLWWPVKDHLYDEPDSLQLSASIPEGLFCVSNGRLVNREVKDGKETFTWKTSYPINSYNATVYIGDYEHFSLPYETNDSTHMLDFYVLPYHLEIAKTHFEQSIGIIHSFENHFGEYPWWNDGYKLVESPYAGMEHQTAIAYGNKYKNQYGNDFDHIILHETAHEWWGNSVSAGDYAEIWLHEGFATYSEALYVEDTKGHDEYLDYLGFYSMLIRNKQALIGPYDVNYWTYKDGDVYMKGALLLHTLRNTIDNDSIFFDIIKTFYKDNAYSIATTKDFIALVNEKTGADYQWFFNQYLYSRVCPQLEWNYRPNPTSKQLEFVYKWNNVNNEFKLPVVLEADGYSQLLYPTPQLQFVPIHSGWAVYINTNNSYISLKKNKRL